MSDEIPQDIRSQARWVYDRLGRGWDADQDTIAWAMALAAKTERERCAKIADEQAEREVYGHAKHTAVTIAQAIRSSHD